MPFDPTRLNEASVSLRQLLDAMPSMAWCADADGHVTYVNPDLSTFAGRPAREFVGMRFVTAVHPHDRDAVRRCWEQAWLDVQPFRCEFRLVRHDGRACWVRGEARPLLSETGKLTGWIGTCTLVHDLKLAQQRASALQHVSGALQVSRTMADVLDVILTLAVPQTGAGSGTVGLLGEGATLHIIDGHVRQAPARTDWPHVPLSDRSPATDTARTGLPRFLGGRHEIRQAHPALHTSRQAEVHALAVLPLRVDDQTLGTLSLHFEEAHDFDEDERNFLLSLAGQCAQALSRARAGDVLARTTALLDLYLDCTPSGVAVFDTDFRFLRVNPAAARFNGVSADEHLGRTLHDVVPAVADDLEANLRRVLETGQPIVEIRASTATRGTHGLVRHWLTNMFPLRGADGRLVGVGTLFDDVTERRETLARLQRSEARFRTLAHATGQVVWTVTPDGRPVDGDLAPIGAVSPPEDDPRNWLDAVHPDDRARTLEAVKRANERREPYEIEHRVSTSDGSYRLMHGRAVPILTDQQEIAEWIGMHVDVTDQRYAESRLRDSEQRYRTLFESMPNILWSSSQEGRVLRFNQHWQDFTGLSVEPEGLSWVQAIHPDDRPRAIQARNEGLAAGRAYAVDVRFRRRDGVYRWHACRVTPLPANVVTSEYQWLGYAVDIHDRVLAEEALRHSEERFRSLVVATSQIVWTAEPDGRPLGLQQGWMNYTGQTADEYVGTGWLDALHPDDRARALSTWQHALGTPRPYEVEVRLRSVDGEYRWFLLRGVPVLEEAGEVREWIGVYMDVHARKLAEARSARFERLVDESHDLIGISDLGGRVQYLNPAGHALLGVTTSKGSESSVADFLFPDDRGFVRDTVVPQVLSTGSWLSDVDFRHARTGERVTVNWNVFLLRDVLTGVPTAFATTARDIRVRKAAEDEQRAVNVRLERRVGERTREVERLSRFNRQLLDSAGEGIFGLNRDGRVTFVNRTASELTGVPAEQMHGRSQHAAMHHTRVDGTPYPVQDCPIDGVLRDGVSRSVQGEVFWRADGTSFPVEYTASPLLDGRGLVEGVVVTFRDITLRQQAEEALLQANRELLRSNRDLEEFAFVASHDLQEPLRTVASFTELLAMQHRAHDDPKADRYVELVLGGVHRMKAIIQDLLTYSRIRMETHESSRVDLSVVVPQVLASLGSAVESSGAQVTWDALPTVMGDAPQLAQVFQNLLGNALKFRRANVPSLVHVGVRKEADEWHFTVADNGIGIEERYFERIFVVFQRLHLREQYDGTGMGLAIVKRVVERHGGRLTVSSTPGAGSEFRFTLPVRLGVS